MGSGEGRRSEGDMRGRGRGELQMRGGMWEKREVKREDGSRERVRIGMGEGRGE